jgi:acyl-CoA synthetase (AMP-forming)/AMP-acid ligase II
MRWQHIRDAYRALKTANILGDAPIKQLMLFIWTCLKYGVSIYSVLAWAAQRYPDRIALIYDTNGTDGDHKNTNSISFQSLLAKAEQLALSLAADGIKAKHTIAFLGRNSPEFVITLLACARLGVNSLLLNTKQSRDELAVIFSNHKIDGVICDKEFIPLIPETEKLLVRDSKYISTPTSIKKLPRRPAGIITIFTSGSTGQAKPIRRKSAFSEVIQTCIYLLDVLQLKTEREILLPLPLFHGHGLASLLLGLVSGSSLHIFAYGNAEKYVQRIQTHRIDTLIVVPTILYRILQQPEFTHSISCIISGSAPLSAELVAHTLTRFGDVLFNVYGTSEAGIIAIATPDDLRAAPQSVGKPLPHLQLKILNRQEIHVCSEFLAKMINTGDNGYLENDCLYLLGRQDELIICGGENAYPQAIEQRIQQQLSYVIDCAVKGIPDEEYGQAVHLFVVLEKDILMANIENDLVAIFSPAFRPKRIMQLKQLPRNAIGKLQRRMLEE